MSTDTRTALGKLAGDILDHFTAEREKSARLQAERDALAMRVVEMTEGWELAKASGFQNQDAMGLALTMTPTEAEQRVREMAEKAELLDLLVQQDGKYAFGQAVTAPGYFLMYKDKFIGKLLLDSGSLLEVIEAIKSHIQERAAKGGSDAGK